MQLCLRLRQQENLKKEAGRQITKCLQTGKQESKLLKNMKTKERVNKKVYKQMVRMLATTKQESKQETNKTSKQTLRMFATKECQQQANRFK